MVYFHRWRNSEANEEFRQAIAIDSGNADIRQQYSVVLGMNGRVEEGIAEARRALESDPLAIDALVLLGYYLACAGRYREAVDIAQRIFALDSMSMFGHMNLGITYAFFGKPDSALATFEKLYQIDPNLAGSGVWLTFGYALVGRRADVARQRAIEERRGLGNSPYLQRTILHLAAGDFDSALATLERSVRNREPLIRGSTLGCDPTFDVFKSNPRFVALVREVDQRLCPAGPVYPIAARRDR